MGDAGGRLRWAARFAFAAALLAVTALSILSIDPTPTPGQSDKLKHFTAYAALGVLAAAGFASSLGGAAALAAGLAVYGGVIELVQHALPDRHASLFDAFANAAGAASGAWAHAALTRVRRRSSV